MVRIALHSLLAVFILLSGCKTVVEDNKEGDDVWEKTGKPVIIQGCEEWKKRNPKADC